MDVVAHHSSDNKKIPSQIAPWIKMDFLTSEVAVIVSNMSGFAKITRDHGAIHYASNVLRMRQICLPILHYYEALLITTEADDLIAVFASAAAAVQTASSMQKTIEKYNAALPADK